MLLEAAVGDAYGAGFEYASRSVIQTHNDLSRYIKHQRHDIVPGCYTDDTQMSLAIAEAIIAREPWTPLNLARRVVAVFKRDEREGYSGHFYEFLKRVDSGERFLAEIVPISDKSGAAMRAAPIGIFPDLDEVIEKASLQAALTHNTPDGIAAAVAAALMSHYCLYRSGPKRDLGLFLERHVPGHPWAEPWRGKVKAQGWMSVRAAVTALLANDRMTSLLRHCIEFSGDVDTVATIALAAGSCCAEIVQDLPANLIDTLENGRYGREYVQDLDRQLHSLRNIPRT